MDGFKTVFNTFGKKNQGEVSLTDLRSIFQSFGRDSQELDSILQELQLENLQEEDTIHFKTFIQIMQRLETEIDRYEPNKYKTLQVPMTGGQDEPVPPKYEMVDEESRIEIENQTQEGYAPESDFDQKIPLQEFPEERSIQGNLNSYKYLDQKATMKRSQSVSQTSAAVGTYQPPKSPSQKERKLYGAMLPQKGVYFLPDLKVVDYIRVLHNYKRQCLKEGKILEVK